MVRNKPSFLDASLYPEKILKLIRVLITFDDITMTAQTILERVNQKPFRPFALETVGGTWIEITDSADVFVYQRKDPVRLVIFDPAGTMFILEPEQISTLESK
jgi:hypothetical protein